MAVTQLNIPNCHWREFERQCENIPIQSGWYAVEHLQSNLWLCIRKNGKSKKARDPDRPCPNDFIVRLYDLQNEKKIWQPDYTQDDVVRSYLGLIPDIHYKLHANKELGTQLIDILFQVAYEAEPRTLENATAMLRQLPGRPIDEILFTFKWLFAQEGVNYPIDKNYLGRRYPLYRIQEVVDGIAIQTVIQRCQARGRLANLPNVHYAHVDQIILR